MWGLRYRLLWFAALTAASLSTSNCTSGLCSRVACSSGEACDPTDGLCKCGAQEGADGGIGGTVCGPNETCDPNLQTCVGNLCALSICSNGNTCDPQDGICKCGGKICTANQPCDPTSHLCASGTACTGVVCAAGYTCDPNDGMCKCHGCPTDPCFGVHCSGADEGIQCIQGVCRCGRANGTVSVSDPVCSRIEHCQDGACHAILGCDEVPRCYGEELCSPIDLQCHCGSRSESAPVCLPGEICQSYGAPHDPFFSGDAGPSYDGGEFFDCRAVDDCHQISCSSGQICDPNQNFNCICETDPLQHGPSCEQNQYCIALDTTKPPVCTPSCNPYIQAECQGANVGPDAGLLYCYAELFGDGGTGAAVCEAPNPLDCSNGDGCGANSDCGPGLGCWPLPLIVDGVEGPIVKICRLYCDTGPGTDGGTHDCLPPLSCTPVGQVQGDGELIQIGFCR